MESPEKKRKKHHWFFEWFLFGLILISICAWQIYTRPVYLFLQTVTVIGNQKIEPEEIARMAGIETGQKPFWIWDARDFFGALRDDLRVAEVLTEYDWPFALTIRIRERRPAAYIASSNGFLAVDATGMVISMSHNLKKMDAPLITGFKAGRCYPGNSIIDGDVTAVLDYLVALNRETQDQISDINIGVKENVTVTTLNNIRVQLGALERVRSKARLTQDILQEVNAKSIPVVYIDIAHETPLLRFRQ
jgi:cell division protein FtsQ